MIKCIFLDWAGTTVDHGCLAPVLVLEDVFASRSVPLERQEARHGMGLLKKDQIREILKLDRVREAWYGVHETYPGASDVQAIYESFVPRQIAVVTQHSRLIDGVLTFVAEVKRRGIPVATTTGYTRDMLEGVRKSAALQGFEPDATVTPDEVSGGRPAPWMIFHLAEKLGIYPLSRCVKIGDTPNDIEEGHNAGTWTVALTSCGNEVGLSQEQYQALSPREKAALTLDAERKLTKAHPDFLAESLGGCIPLIDEIELRISSGLMR